MTISTGGLHRQEDGSYIDALKVKVNVQEKYKTAFEILTLVNKERAKAGVPGVKNGSESSGKCHAEGCRDEAFTGAIQDRPEAIAFQQIP